MNDEKLRRLSDLAEKLYAEFLSNETICGLTSLFKKNKVGSKTGGHIRRMLYQKYGKQNIDKISFKRTSINAHKVRSRESYKHSEEWNENIRLGNEKKWSQDDGSRRKLSKQLMINHCQPNSQTEETKKKRIEARRNGKGWHKHSENTKQKISKVFKSKWENGDYINRAQSFISKSQLEIKSIIEELGFSVNLEYFIDGRPYDILVKEKKLIIEYNGTYWHFDPRVYDKNHYDKSTQKYAFQIWERDKEKLDNAKNHGYNVLVIWERDWEECQNKKKLIETILC